MHIKTDQSGSGEVKPNHMDKVLNKYDKSTWPLGQAVRFGQAIRSGYLAKAILGVGPQ